MTADATRRPWSATTCEICEGEGTLPGDATWPPDRPFVLAGWALPRGVCWYCKGSGWYEAAT